MTLPTLYKITKTGKVQQSIISYIKDRFIVTFGQVNGKQQIQSTTCETTNAGRSNERNPEEQAEFEALALHAKKIKAGYVLDESGESEVELPMKVKVMQDQWDNVVYPCISTPKLNGVNGTYKLENDVLNLYSRGGNLYPPIPHLEKDIREVMDHLRTFKLNGELYIHGEHLQDITSAVKKPKELSKQLEFAIFDTCHDFDYDARREKMLDLEDVSEYDYVSFLTGVVCHNREDIETHYNQCMHSKLEGTVVKNLTGKYVHGTRSSDQFKYKKAQDAEFKVVGYKLDKYNHAVWSCITPEDKTFSVKTKGSNASRLFHAANADNFIGKWLKIEFETYSKDMIPLKPVGIMFRDCDESGQPLE